MPVSRGTWRCVLSFQASRSNNELSQPFRMSRGRQNLNLCSDAELETKQSTQQSQVSRHRCLRGNSATRVAQILSACFGMQQEDMPFCAPAIEERLLCTSSRSLKGAFQANLRGTIFIGSATLLLGGQYLLVRTICNRVRVLRKRAGILIQTHLSHNDSALRLAGRNQN